MASPVEPITSLSEPITSLPKSAPQFVANLDDAPMWIPSAWLPADLAEDELDESTLEREIANLASGMLTNLATHPDNRTRFYKLELQATLGDTKERMVADKITDSGRRACLWSTGACLRSTGARLWSTSACLWSNSACLWSTGARLWSTNACLWSTSACLWSTGARLWSTGACLWSTVVSHISSFDGREAL
eukprot:8817966-Pyramimonas_sp.AAC.1